MFAAPNIRDVEAQQAASQPASSAYPQGSGDQKIVMTTTSTSYNTNPNMPQTQNFPTNQQQNGGVTQPSSDAPKSTIARAAHAINWGSYLMLVAFFSLIQMIAASQVCGDNNGSCSNIQGYQVSAGVISMCIAFVFGIVHLAGGLDNAGIKIAVSVFLFLWWIAGVIVLTFIGDFQLTTRAAGYFSTWLAFAFSALSLVAVSESFETGLDSTMQSVRKPVFFLVLASLVAMGASISPCSPRNVCNGYNAYAVVLSVVSLVLGLILFCFPGRLERKAMKGVAVFFVVWWVFGAAVTTLGGPWLIAGNGFFSAYCALVASIAFFAALNRTT